MVTVNQSYYGPCMTWCEKTWLNVTSSTYLSIVSSERTSCHNTISSLCLLDLITLTQSLSMALSCSLFINSYNGRIISIIPIYLTCQHSAIHLRENYMNIKSPQEPTTPPPIIRPPFTVEIYSLKVSQINNTDQVLVIWYFHQNSEIFKALRLMLLDCRN